MKNAVIIYQATKYNFSVSIFHKLCDNLNDLFIIGRSNYGKLFACYTFQGFDDTIGNEKSGN